MSDSLLVVLRGRPQLRPGTSIHSLGIVAERASSMPIVTF